MKKYINAATNKEVKIGDVVIVPAYNNYECKKFNMPVNVTEKSLERLISDGYVRVVELEDINKEMISNVQLPEKEKQAIDLITLIAKASILFNSRVLEKDKNQAIIYYMSPDGSIMPILNNGDLSSSFYRLEDAKRTCQLLSKEIELVNNE